MKLVGKIEPIGETHIDDIRLDNLKALTAVVDDLLANIHLVARYENNNEHSLMQAGAHAAGFFRHIEREYKLKELKADDK